MKVETIENGIKVTIPEKQNYTLYELKQRLINLLYANIGYLERYKNDIELLEIILTYEINPK